jgi:hypothetical protein
MRVISFIIIPTLNMATLYEYVPHLFKNNFPIHRKFVLPCRMKNKRTPPTRRSGPSARSLGQQTSSTASVHPIKGVPPEARYTPPPFDPVPVKPRHDGWTPKKQHDFIEALAATACVTEAAKAVGMSPKSAYFLRERDDAASFHAAWIAAQHYAVATLEGAAFSRAIHGVPVPHYYKGELVGEHRKYNDGLAMFLMRHNDLGRYGKGWDRLSPHEFGPATGAGFRAEYLQASLHDLDANDPAAVSDLQKRKAARGDGS